jgi:hypothetical protein
VLRCSWPCKLLPALLHELLVVEYAHTRLVSAVRSVLLTNGAHHGVTAELERTRACGSGRCPEPTITPCCSTTPAARRRRRACRTSRTRSSCCPCWGTICWITGLPELLTTVCRWQEAQQRARKLVRHSTLGHSPRSGGGDVFRT